MNTTKPQGLIYGANGYTGGLIARRAVLDGQRPILAGRNGPQIEAVARELELPFRVFALDAAAGNLDGVTAVLHCAGPFEQTARPMMEACLHAGVHYLDITGEWSVIEHAAQLDQRARSAGIVMMPAVGFDVVPSDCLAAQLAAALPTASTLELAFSALGGANPISPGTATTIFSQVGRPNYVRQAGRIEKVPADWESVTIEFPSGKRSAVMISWGDIASAFHTTGIPNIRVFNAVPKRQIQRLRRWNWLLPLAGWSPVQWLGRKWIKRNVPGPSESDRTSGRTEFWGRATDTNGNVAEATLTTPEGYALTVLTATEILRRAAAGEVPPGFSTPAKAFGGTFIEQFAGVEFVWRTKPQ